MHPVVLVGACAVAAVGAGIVIGRQSHVVAGVFLAACGVVLGAYDLASHRLPNRLVAVTAAGLLLLLLAASWHSGDWSALGRGVLAALVVGAGFLLLAVVEPTGLGMGDVKLAAVLSLWLGWLSWQSVAFGIFAAFFGGGILSIVLLATRRARRDSHIAFGPWLLAGTAVATALHELLDDAILDLVL